MQLYDKDYMKENVTCIFFTFLDLTTGGKCKRVLWNYIFRQVLLIGLLYMFICSLDFLSSAFRLLGGKKKSGGQLFSWGGFIIIYLCSTCIYPRQNDR